MAPKAAPAPAPRAALAEKDPTPLHENFANWLTRETGYEVDLKTVQLAAVLRGAFQKSEENQADLEQRRAAAEQRVAAREERAQERATKAAAPKTEPKAAAAPATPKPKAPKKAAAAEEATPTVARPARRGRRAAAAS